MMGKTLNTSENDDANVLFIKVLLMQWTNLKLDLKFGQRYNFSFKPPNISGEIYPYAGRFRPKVLLRLDVIDRILGGGAPALDDDGEQGDDEAGKPGNSEYPGAERDAIGEVGEPVAHDIIGDRYGDDK